MGSGMAKNLVASGAKVIVNDVSAEATQLLQDTGAATAATPAELASQVDLLFTCLPYAPEVEAVLFGDNGVTSGKHEGLTVIDTTTLNYHAALAIAEKATAAGMDYSDCPISGMPHRAQDGTLTMMFGGSEATFNRVRPHLESMGNYIVHCGECGMGQVMKAVNNIIYNINIAALCEVLPLAVKAGLHPERLADVVTSASSRSFASEYFVPAHFGP